MSLWMDVGCGLRAQGDVNVDLYLDNRHRVTKGKINVKNLNHFIKADAHHLPIRDNIFDKVICQQLIEHVKNPWFLVKELYRTSKKEVFIECPHRMYWFRPKQHVNFFNVNWFRKILPSLGINKFKISTIYRGFPHKLLPIISWPLNIRVEITK